MDKNSYKHFPCPIHPNETIQRVYIGDEEVSSLRCIECILTTSVKITKDNLLTLNDFIEKAIAYHEKLNSSMSISESAPSDLVEFLSGEEDFTIKLTEHIENEKQKASQAINALLQEFAVMCHDKKEEMHKILDKQLNNMKTNFAYYKSKIDKYYNAGNSEETLDREKIYQKINDCNDISDLELFIKNLKDDLLDSKTFKDPTLFKKEIEQNLLEVADIIKKNMNDLPTLKLSDEGSFKQELDKFKGTTSKFIEGLSATMFEIDELSLSNAVTMDSKILTKGEDKKLLKKFVRENGNVKFTLLYRATRDGFDVNKFHQLCDQAKETVVVGRSTHKKIFGGYSDQSWAPTNNYRYSSKAFLFSVDEKKKYPCMANKFNSAVYSAANYGPTFGAGHDLYIALASNGTLSYSNFGNTYDSTGVTGNKQLLLAGAYQFALEEFEVFQVSESKGLNLSYPQSKIANGNDFNALKGWIAPGKNVSFELLHKGTKDGFDAVNFHTNCDTKGAVVVICKSNFNRIFGGYTSKGWIHNEDFTKDKNAFLFSLTDKKKLEIISGGDCATFGSIEAGPIFGAGYDLFICSNSNLLEDSSSNLGLTYSSSGVKGEPSCYLAGSSKFLLEEIEVYKVNIS